LQPIVLSKHYKNEKSDLNFTNQEEWGRKEKIRSKRENKRLLASTMPGGGVRKYEERSWGW